jgi:hypothetical protein
LKSKKFVKDYLKNDTTEKLDSLKEQVSGVSKDDSIKNSFSKKIKRFCSMKSCLKPDHCLDEFTDASYFECRSC